MTNWHLWLLFVCLTLMMITICLFLYIYVFIKVSTGSKIMFVKVVSGILIVSSVAALGNILSDYAINLCPQSHPNMTENNQT